METYNIYDQFEDKVGVFNGTEQEVKDYIYDRNAYHGFQSGFYYERAQG